MAGFRKYEDMKKSELVEMCELFGIDVHSKDTRQILIDKLNSRVDNRAAQEEQPAAPGRGRTARRSRRQSEDDRLNEEKKQAIKRQTEEVMDSYADRPIDGLRPKVLKAPRTVEQTNEALDRIDGELAASMVDPYHTLIGTMLGPKSSETRTMPDGRKVEFVNYMVAYGPYVVLIPSFKFWYDWEDQSKHPVGKLYEQGASMEGLKIEFNMFRKEGGIGGEIYGTRLYATRIRRCEEWYSTLSDGSWAIDEGSIIKATITRVRPYSIEIEAYGAEASIPIKEVSHFYLDRIDTNDENCEFWTGKEIFVKVSNIKRAPMPGNLTRFEFPVSFDASIKGAQKNPQIVNFDKYDKGDLLPATITNIKNYEEEGAKNGKKLYYCNINNQIVAAADLGPGAGRGAIPVIGSKVKIRIVDKRREDHTFYGLIVNVKKESGDREAFAVLDYDS